MKTIINNLFSQFDLSLIELEIGSLYKFEDNNKKSYWLIIESNNLNNIIENQADYFEKSKEKINDEWFDKNVNLLILHQIEDFENIQNIVLTIEENPYLFKKQVLLYKGHEIEKLKNIIESESTNIKNFIENKILDESIFKVHKENINNNNYESLLYRLVHKIPFIKLNIQRKDNLEVLTDNNIQKIRSNSFESLNSYIEQNFFNRDLEFIEQMDSDSVYNLLIKIDQNEN
ncbi:hypothetical protein HX057_16835 [Myroides odoratimimus]|uniref:ABC-three component system middle component 1 n=2 Tax=Myroides odoratimimus TaxID=76832 RepID=UPI002576574B|nr:ABC-three component system middle component 1 [Myroides odoratimimus]MDM1415782.1 hypothetical protein [Myroides odoratimimus]MDM1448384.1 hypothetical protein [Myroides odoratimimus]MDM1511084.1 hypothetical protein [Myroides odoratimimus]MEC4009204.1 ABC-three component system middle component 1 [Myroides odoratimimus]